MVDLHRLRERLLPGAALPALVVALVTAGVGALYVLAFSAALGDPQPRNVPIAVVGVSPASIDAAFDGDVSATAADGAAAARAALGQQQVDGAVIVDASSAELDVASAAGPSVARVLEQGATTLRSALGTRVTVRDLHPIDQRDPSGTVFFYVVLASVITGFVGTVQTRVNAADLDLRGELAWDAGRAALCGLALAVMLGPVGHFEQVPFPAAWIVLALTNWAAGTTFSVWRDVVGARWALLPTWILFILVSTPSSGGAVAGPLLPVPLAIVGGWLPTGAAVTLLRDVTYYPGALHPMPFVVIAAWSVAPAVVFVLLERRARRRTRAGTS